MLQEFFTEDLTLLMLLSKGSRLTLMLYDVKVEV